MIRGAWALFTILPFVLGISVILGSLTAWPALLVFNAAYFAISFNSAVCFFLIGLALCASMYDGVLAKCLQIFFGLSVMIISVLNHSAHMAPNTAFAFMLASFVLLLLPLAQKKYVGILIDVLIFILFLVSTLGVSGYLLNIEFLYSWYSHNGMDLVSAISFLSISICLAGIWRSMAASIDLYKGREDTRIILLSSAILLCMAFAVTLANFATLMKQQNDAVGASFQRLQISRSLFFQNEIVHAIDETNIMRSSDIFQNQINKISDNASAVSFDSLLKLFSAQGFSAVVIYNGSGQKVASMGNFIKQAPFNFKKKITNGYLNILWKNGWYVQIVSDIDPKKNKAGLLVVEWPLVDINKVFSRAQMMGATGDVSICMAVTDGVARCFSSRENAVTFSSNFLPVHNALQKKTGLMTLEDNKYIKILAAFGPIGILDLGMVVKMSMTEIENPITKSLRTMMPVIALAIIIGLLLLRLQVVPLVQRVINAEKKLSNSNKRLEESEERYALAIRGSSIGLWDWDIVHDKVFYSPYFKGLLGYADGEFANTVAAFKNVLHPEDVARVEEAIEKHLYDQIPYSIEYRLKRKTGDYHWFYAKGMALWNDKGQPTRMAGSLLDITDRKRAEQRLAAQYAVTQLLSEADSIEKIAEKIIQSVGENLEWDFGSLWVVDNQENVMRSVGVWHQPGLDASALSKATRNMALAIGEGLPGRVWQTGQYIWLSDVIADKTFSRIAEAKAANLHSVFCFPIRIENKVLGALEFLVQRRQGADDVMLKMMAAITVQIGFFMQRKIAEKQFNERDYHV